MSDKQYETGQVTDVDQIRSFISFLDEKNKVISRLLSSISDITTTIYNMNCSNVYISEINSDNMESVKKELMEKLGRLIFHVIG